MRFNPNLYPPNGYIYTDAQGVKHRGDSWRNLFWTITEFRKRNGIPVGNVEEDVDHQHCSQYPGLCQNDPVVPQPARGGPNLNSRVLNWLAFQLSKLRHNGTVARPTIDEAIARSNICIRCPRQQGLSLACSNCVEAVDGARKAFLGDKGSVNKSLLPCVTLGEDTQISIHIIQPPSDESALPPNCWRRQ